MSNDPNDPRNVRARQRADRIREMVPIAAVLASYGYPVRVDAAHREQQFCCDLHGDGRDTKPSARVYPYSQSAYCFACDKTRDAIEMVRAKEGLDFWGAVKKLEADYDLPALPVEYGYEPAADPYQAFDQKAADLDPHKTFEEDCRALARLLEALSAPPRQLTLDDALAYWEGLDRVVHLVQGEKEGEPGEWDESRGRAALASLLARLRQQMQGEPR